MDQSQLRLIFLGQVAGPVEYAGAQWLQIHGAQNPLADYGFQGRRILQVDPRPDRAIGIVEDLGAGRPQNQAPVNPHALRGDHDEVGVIGRGALDDFLSRLAILHQLLYRKVPPALVQETLELLHMGAMQILEPAVVRGLNHVQQDQVRLEAAGERLHVGGSATATAGEIDREEDLAKLEHDPEFYSSLMLVGFRERIVWARKPNIQRGQKKNAHHQHRHQPAHNHDRKRALRIRADAMRGGRRHEAERGYQHGHQDGAEAQNSTLLDRIQDRKAARAQLVDVLQHDHAGLHGDAEERQESNPGGDAEVRFGQVERQNPADRRHGDRNQDEAGPFHGGEHGIQNQEDYQKRQRNDQRQPLLGALLRLVFAGPLQAISRRQLDGFGNRRDGFLHRAAQVAPANAVLDGHVALVPFPVDLRGAIPYGHVAELAERHTLAGRSQQADIADLLDGGAVLRLIPHHQVIALLAFQHRRHGLAAGGGLDGVLHIGHVDAEAGGLVAIHREVQVGLADDPENAQILHPANLAPDTP